LGQDLAHLIQSCDWYDPLVYARDKIVHENLQVIVFLYPRILFQIYAKDENNKNNLPVGLVNIPEVMVNKNLVNFELYAAVHIGYSFSLLEGFANWAITFFKSQDMLILNTQRWAMQVLMSSKIQLKKSSPIKSNRIRMQEKKC
jgi:hypothetical protein